MKIFALETSLTKAKNIFLDANETEIMTVFRSWYFFLFKSLPWTMLGFFLLGLYVQAFRQFPAVLPWFTYVLLTVFVIVVLPPIINAFIQWRFSFIIVLSDEIGIVLQYSIFRRDVLHVNLEELSGVSVKTQFLNIFPFGLLHIDLKGSTDFVVFDYVRNADHIADDISDVTASFQKK